MIGNHERIIINVTSKTTKIIEQEYVVISFVNGWVGTRLVIN
jgi:hypothetical protein